MIPLTTQESTRPDDAKDAKPQKPEKQQKILLYNWVPDGTPMSRLRQIDAQSHIKLFGNVLPDKGESGEVDPEDILRVLDNKDVPPAYSGYIMFSFEGGFWENLHKGPGHPDYDRTVASMINLIRVAKTHYPNAKFAYWGFPHVPYWLPNEGEGSSNWTQATEQQKNDAMDRAVAIYQPIANEVDWLAPWGYDENEAALAVGKSWEEASKEAQRNWMRAKVAVG